MINIEVLKDCMAMQKQKLILLEKRKKRLLFSLKDVCMEIVSTEEKLKTLAELPGKQED